MERKIYNKPFLVREQFMPQDYVAACIPVGQGFHVDFLSGIGTYGKYDGPNNERVTEAWGPAALKNHKGESFTVDIYRWCDVDKPTYQGGGNWDNLWSPSTCVHVFTNSGPTSAGNPYSYYDGHDRYGWNYSGGHFVKMAEGVTLTVSSSGNRATISGGSVLNGFVASNAS